MRRTLYSFLSIFLCLCNDFQIKSFKKKEKMPRGSFKNADVQATLSTKELR